MCIGKCTMNARHAGAFHSIGVGCAQLLLESFQCDALAFGAERGLVQESFWGHVAVVLHFLGDRFEKIHVTFILCSSFIGSSQQ